MSKFDQWIEITKTKIKELDEKLEKIECLMVHYMKIKRRNGDTDEKVDEKILYCKTVRKAILDELKELDEHLKDTIELKNDFFKN